tara:strand:- start:2264 stop:3178 length:915 start_codon:yes stop_codon:yes gene_type:complete
MQEDAKNDMVDIDTSGPAVDVDLESPKVEEVESKEEAIEVVQEQPKEKKLEQNDELEEYSDGVKRRINKLTRKMREAERQKEEAIDYAKTVKESSEKLRKQYAHLKTGSLKDKEEKISSSLKASYATLAAAREANDLASEVEAQKEIAKLGYEEARLTEQKQYIADNPVNQREVNIAPNRAKPAAEPDPKALDWSHNNRWFGKDTAMTYTAFDLHTKLVDEEGYDPQSNEYYSEIDKRIRLEFPQKFDTKEERESTKPTQTVASARRSVKSSRKSVRLTPTEVAIAKKLGVPLEEYAKHKNTEV